MQYRSEQTDQISAALSKAQAMLEGAQLTGVNPHLKTSYSNLSDLMAAIRKPLGEHGLSIIHTPVCDANGWFLESQLLHESGQWIGCKLPILLGKNGNNQEFGSALTYMKRYAVGCLTGIAPAGDPADDDAEKTMHAPPVQPDFVKPKRAISEMQAKMVIAKAKKLDGLLERVERGWGTVPRLDPSDLPKVLFYIAAKKEQKGIPLDQRDQKDLAEGKALGFTMESIVQEIKDHQG